MSLFSCAMQLVVESSGRENFMFWPTFGFDGYGKQLRLFCFSTTGPCQPPIFLRLSDIQIFTTWKNLTHPEQVKTKEIWSMASQLLGLVVMLSLLLLLPNTQPLRRIPRLNCLPMIMNDFLDICWYLIIRIGVRQTFIANVCIFSLPTFWTAC